MIAVNCGTVSLSITVTRSVNEDRRSDLISAKQWATRERKWPGRLPSGPPEAPAWKDNISLQTSPPVVTARNTDPSGGLGRLSF